MVLKFTGAYRQCEGAGGTTSYRNRPHHRYPLVVGEDYPTTDHSRERYAYLQAASSSSTPAWDFTSIRSDEGSASARAKCVIPGGSAAGKASVESDVALEDDGEAKEWIAQVEPGVQITFLSLPGGAGNDLKRIRFSREMFNKWQAQRWWGENFDRIMELYNVQRFNRQALPTPPRSDDGGERESIYSQVGSTRESPATPPQGRDRLARNAYRPPSASGRGLGGAYNLPSVPDPSEHIIPQYLRSFGSSSGAMAAGAMAAGAMAAGARGENSSVDASRTTTSSREEAASISISNASDQEMTEWVEQDQPGVYITIRELPDGTRELRRVRFSRERFGEVHAKLWWEENRERIQAQYL